VNARRSIGEGEIHDPIARKIAAVSEALTLAEAGAAGAGREPYSDGAIIERSRSEPELFAEVFDRHYAAIHGYVARRLGPSLAEDVASETFLIAFDRRARWNPAHLDARPWLYGIAFNLVSRHRRAEVRRYRALARAGSTDALDGHADGVAARLDVEAFRGRLAAALAEIAESDREVLLLVAWAGLNCEEAAQALGIPPGTARSRLHRARRKTRAAIGDVDIPTGEGDLSWTT
jgi:RNA polymerase sigma factor (sigma-70 family)